MACPTCGNSVLFGGIKNGNKKYCSKKCHDADKINRVAESIPDSKANELAIKINQSNCPECNGVGPLDIHHSHSVYSIVLFTSWNTKEHLTCKTCATKQQTMDLVKSLLLGWWGIPFGLIVTPIQIARNVVAMFKKPGQSGPTKALLQRAKIMLAAKHLENA